jgi:hypothetical protein
MFLEKRVYQGSYPPNDLRWYANIPVPTRYMAMGSNEDFFGGYDHKHKVRMADFMIFPERILASNVPAS